MNHVIFRIKSLAIVCSSIYIPMWLFFIVGSLLPGNSFETFLGIRPRTFSLNQPLAIIGSWIPHVSYSHIINNSIVLFGLLFFVSLIESKPMRLISILIVFSGFLTWLLGSSHSIHMGASGLVFALFGYICSSFIFSRKWLYSIPIFFFALYYGATYFTSMLSGLIPNQYTSFAAHFGGLIAGILIGIIYERVSKKTK